MIFHDGNLLGDEFLDISEVSDIVIVTERYCDPLGSGSPSPTDTMDIGFGDIWDIVVDHIFEGIDIDPTRGNIGCDEHASGLFFEIGERALSIILRFIPMDSFRDDATSDEEFHHLVRPMLRPREDEYILDLRILEQVNDEAVFTTFIDMIDVLTDRLGSGCDRGDFDLLRIAEDGPREGLDLRRHRC